MRERWGRKPDYPGKKLRRTAQRRRCHIQKLSRQEIWTLDLYNGDKWVFNHYTTGLPSYWSWTQQPRLLCSQSTSLSNPWNARKSSPGQWSRRRKLSPGKAVLIGGCLQAKDRRSITSSLREPRSLLATRRRTSTTRASAREDVWNKLAWRLESVS